MNEEEQGWLLDAMEEFNSSPTLAQTLKMKELSKKRQLTQEQVRELLKGGRNNELARVVFRNEQLYRFFPREYTPNQMKEEILKILKAWMAHMTEGGKQAWEK